MTTTTTETRTMYMHTLDGQPASYDATNGPYVYFVGGRNRVRLERSLRRLRMQQRWAKSQDEKEGRDPNRFDYGYVLVEVPHV